MSKTSVILTSPYFPGCYVTEIDDQECTVTPDKEVEQPKEVKLKKDGTEKHITSNKKKGRKSEVYPFEIEDVKKILKYFEDNSLWQCYLIFVVSLNMARRISDTLSLQWYHFLNESTGKFRADLSEIEEQKTDKLANPRINSAVRSAIELYISKVGVNPASNNYQDYVFVQNSGNYAGRVMTADGYRKNLKKAAIAVGIEYNVGTHSTRKTFGKFSRMLHPGDYDSMELLQTIYNHTDTKTTKHYIGLTKQKIDQYYDDFGCFFDDYVTGDKTYTEVAETPIVSIDTNDLRDIIRAAYKAGGDNAGCSDPMVHVDAINSIMAMIEELQK